jgi:MOSC domain-containing protein YiiM
MADVLRLWIATGHRQPMREMEAVIAIEDRGFEGCTHGRPGSSRQVLLMDSETLADLGVEHGAVRENVTTRGLAVGGLRPGDCIKLGEALLRVTKPCAPCPRMDEVRPGLQSEIDGRRGMLCRVLRGGRIRRGDAIEVEAAVAAQGAAL